MPKILVVDDDPDVVDAVTAYLERAGHTVKGAGSRREGRQAIAADPPDLVILDVMMEEPDDGFALAQELRRDGFRNPILILTSISRVMGLSYGVDEATAPVDDFVEKPIAPQALIEKVQALLAKREG